MPLISTKSISTIGSTRMVMAGIWLTTTVRLKVEENQLVEVFGEIGTRVEGLKGA